MRLHRLELTAFGPFAEHHEVDFDALGRAGLFLLSGPTGSGKTTILDAVAYALYGCSLGARKGRDPVSQHRAVEVEPSVTLEATIGDRRVRIRRSPRHERPRKRGEGLATQNPTAHLEVADGGRWEVVSSSKSEVDATIEDWIGMNHGQFCQVVILPQGEFATFLRAGADDRRTLLSQLFPTHDFAGVEKWLWQNAKDRAAECKVKRTEIDRQVAAAEAAAAGADEGVGLDEADAASGEAAVDEAGTDDGETAVDEVGRDAPDAEHEAPAATATPGSPEEVPEWIERVESSLAADLDRIEAELTNAQQAHEKAEASFQAARKRQDSIDEAARDERAAAAELDRALERLAGVSELAEVDPGKDPATTRKLANRLRSSADRLGEFLERAEGERTECADAKSRAESSIATAEKEIAAVDEILREGPAREEELARRLSDAEAATGGLEDGRQAVEALARKVESAARRDRLSPQIEEAEKRYLEAREALTEARERRVAIREARLAGMAAELAGQLADGEPCQVCGSTEHPSKAHSEQDEASKEQEDAAEARVAECEKAAEKARSHRDEIATDRAARDAEAGGRPHEELEAEHRKAAKALADREAKAAGKDELAGSLAKLREERDQAAERRRKAEAELAAAKTELQTVENRLAKIGEEADRLREDEPDVAQRRDRLAKAVESLEAACDAAEARDRAAKAKAKAEARELPVALDAATRARDEAAKARDAISNRRATVEDRLRNFRRQAEPLPRMIAELEPLEQASATARELADLTSGANARKLPLSTYVLAARLEQVIEAANQRLGPMSGGRYRLTYRAETDGRERKGGLGIAILDSHTGAERETATLSGGESFYASLSLALGLAEVVQRESGGRRLESLFIDEGFGTLDSETLNDVMAVLDELREGGRAVGVVSHVEELRERIDARIDVRPGPDGSTLTLVGVS